MIELNEKAGIYAEENVINILKEAFAKVYADGYRDGYKDREEEIPVDLKSNQTEFVDLGLPSGTMWSSDYEKSDNEVLFLPYIKAQGMDIPTDYSSTGITFGGITCIGPNGNSVKFRSKGYMKDNNRIGNVNYGGGKVYFWIHDDEDNSEHEKKVLTVDGGSKRSPNKEITKLFSGYKCPVRLVKVK